MFDALYQIFSINNLLGYECGYRMCLSLSDRMLLGSYLIRFLPILLICLMLIFKNNKNKLIILSTFLVLSNIFIVMSGERTSVILMIILNILVLTLLELFRKYRKYLFVVTLILVSAMLFFNPKIKERQIDYTLSQLNIDLNNGKFSIFSDKHDAMFKTSINMFSSNVLVGVGPKLFRVKCNEAKYAVDEDLSCSTHPHNIYVQAFAETGLIGGLLLIFLFLFCFYLIIKNIKKYSANNKNDLKDYISCLLICFFINLWPIVPSLNMFNNWINILYFLPVGFYLFFISLNKDKLKLK